VKISVAMATYNGAKYITEQLDSIFKQSQLPDELVVCDDCSVDNTLNILKECAQNAPLEMKIFINEQRLGYSRNFERCMQLCTGEIIFISDQDDVWFTNKIEKIAAIARSSGTKQVFVHDALFTDHRLNSMHITNSSQQNAQNSHIMGGQAGCCTAVKKQFVDAIFPSQGLYNHTPGYDVWINHLSYYSDSRCFVQDCLQYRRFHDGNASDSLLRFSIRRYFSNYKNIRQILSQKLDFLCRVQGMSQKIAHSFHCGNLDEKYSHKQQLLKNRIENLRYRLYLFQLSRLQKIRSAAWFYFRGGYADFNGWKSLLSDVVS